MKNIVVLIFCIVLNWTAASLAEALELTVNGQSDYEIVLPSDATAAEKKASEELQDYLRQISGTTIHTATTPQSNKKQILIGQSPAIQTLLPDVKFAELRPDELIIRTSGDKLILSGGRPRGTLYAVYTLLEDQLGVRWWTSLDSCVPKQNNITLPEMNIRYAPAIESREAYYRDIVRNPEFAVRLKNNGHHIQAGERLGRNNEIIGFVHTFDQFIPASQYLSSHPEWFSLVAGKRAGGQKQGQLCLSNDEMRQTLTGVVLNKLRQTAFPQIISISQNDNINYCQCPKCKAVDNAEGSPSGSLIAFVNKVAADIEKEFPDVKVETLAYQYTRKPPAAARPRRNVIIRLCSIECDFAKPLNSDANRDFRDDILKWSIIAPQLAIWNYTANFSQYLIPHPNLSNAGGDIRFFADNKTVALFEHGDCNSGNLTGDFAALRAWVLSKLAWNLQLDQDKLIDTFLAGYYGAAAPYLKDYLNLMEKEMKCSGRRLSCNEGDTADWLSPDAINIATGFFDQAEAAVKNDPALSARVKCARFSLDNVWGYRGKSLRESAQKQNKPYCGPADLDAFQEQFIRYAETLKVERYSEYGPFSAYIALLKKNNAASEKIPLPADLKNVDGKEWHDFPPEKFDLYKPGELCFIEADAAASNGQAVRMPGSHTEWAVQCTPPADLVKGKKWRVCLTARCEAGNQEGNAIRAGIYDVSARRSITSKTISSKMLDGSKYQLIDMGTFELKSKMYFWVCPQANPNVKNVWIDRVFIIAEE